MEIRHDEHDKKGSFLIEENGEQLGRLDYKSSPGRITIYHTEIDKSLRGEGLGQDLVGSAVKFARENSLRIVATCPYAKKLIEETPEFRDVLA